MKRVAIIDSGSGGVNVLKSLMTNCKGFDFLYFADNEFAPYGEKSSAFLQARANELVGFFQKIFAPEIVIFACNTLTAVAIEEARKNFPHLKFIGCEPALKPACEQFDQKDVLLLATEVTTKKCRLVKSYPNIQKKVIPSLPKLIDEHLFELEVLQPYLEENLKDLKFSAIVLGCTHFEAIRQNLCQISGAKLFGSNFGIAKMLSSFGGEGEQNSCSFMTSGNPDNLPKLFHFLMKN